MATLKVPELGEFLREQRQGAKLSLRQLAEAAGVSNPYLSQVERGLRKPSAEVLQQIAKGLRISAEVLYVRAGILEEGSGRAEVETAVMADPHLNERQRRALLDVYASFRSENAREAELAAAGDAAPAPAPAPGADEQADQPAATTPRTPRRKAPASRTTGAAARPRAARSTTTTKTTQTTQSTKNTGGQ
jgi:transcriptional regulator with XRE-family HTH domain